MRIPERKLSPDKGHGGWEQYGAECEGCDSGGYKGADLGVTYDMYQASTYTVAGPAVFSCWRRRAVMSVCDVDVGAILGFMYGVSCD
jgi:hypothetical protein